MDPSFAELFASLNDEARSVLTDATGASWAPRASVFDQGETLIPPTAQAQQPRPIRPPITPRRPVPKDVRAATLDSIRALMMVRVYRVRGHLEAKLDPLGLQVPKSHPELDPKNYGFSPGRLGPPDFHRPRAGP